MQVSVRGRAASGPMREWVTFQDPKRKKHVWHVDVTFMTSHWNCIFGRGCQGVLTDEAPELVQGCCSYGAHASDDEGPGAREPRREAARRRHVAVPQAGQEEGHLGQGRQGRLAHPARRRRVHLPEPSRLRHRSRLRVAPARRARPGSTTATSSPRSAGSSRCATSRSTTRTRTTASCTTGSPSSPATAGVRAARSSRGGAPRSPRRSPVREPVYRSLEPELRKMCGDELYELIAEYLDERLGVRPGAGARTRRRCRSARPDPRRPQRLSRLPRCRTTRRRARRRPRRRAAARWSTSSRPLAVDDWFRPTPAWSWDVRDTVAHLADTDELAIDTCTDGPRSLGTVADRCASSEDVTLLGVLRGRRHVGADVLAWWRRDPGRRSARCCSTLDPRRACRGVSGCGRRRSSPPGSWRRGPTASTSTTALGTEPGRHRPPRATSPGSAVRALPYAFSVAGVAPPAAPLRVELTLPSARRGRPGRRTRPTASPGRAVGVLPGVRAAAARRARPGLVAEGDGAALGAARGTLVPLTGGPACRCTRSRA